ncbi:MAG TPA: lipopolysaccharide heptosyltransferase I [Methylomirabilota bacterium]|nr:lipopolysaccharide heptosyltransferase I [Methylomirabilota bacterium]
MKVAIVKLSALGDVVHALPLARAIRRAHPLAQITWIVERRESAILRGHPDLDRVIPVDTRRWRRLLRYPEGAREVWGKVSGLRRRVRMADLDVAIDCQGLLKSGLLTAFTGARLRIGFRRAYCRERLNVLFTNRRVRPPAAAVHVVDQNLALLAPLGIAAAPAEFVLPVRPEVDRRMEQALTAVGLTNGERVVALNPGAGRKDKLWPIECFRDLAERLIAQADARVLILWGPDELPLAQRIATGLSAQVAPPTDLDELTAVLRRVSLIIAGDTGPLHLAAALGTPALGLYGPTSVERNGPYGAEHQGLQSPDGTMGGLTPEVVLDAAQAMLARSAPR